MYFELSTLWGAGGINLPSNFVEVLTIILVVVVAVVCAVLAGFLIGLIANLMSRLFTTKPIPPRANVIVRVVGGMAVGILVGMLLYDSSGGGSGNGSGDGSGNGKAGNNQSSNPETPKNTDNNVIVSGEKILRIQVLSPVANATKNDLFRLPELSGKTRYTLEELKKKVTGLTDINKVLLVTYGDSPDDESQLMLQLKQWLKNVRELKVDQFKREGESAPK